MSITFGKYKGKSVSVVKMDKQYCEWMKGVAKKEPFSVIGKFVNQYLSLEEEQCSPICSTIKLGAFNKATGNYVYPRIANSMNEYICPSCNESVMYNSKMNCFYHTYESSFKCEYYSSPSKQQIQTDGINLYSKLIKDGVKMCIYYYCMDCKHKYCTMDSISRECINLEELITVVNKVELQRNTVLELSSISISKLKCKGCEFNGKLMDIYLDKYVRYKLEQTVFTDSFLSECDSFDGCKCDYCLFRMNDHLEIDCDACEDTRTNKNIMERFGEYFVDKKPIIHSREHNFHDVYVVSSVNYKRYNYWDYYGFARCNSIYPVLERIDLDNYLDTVERIIQIIKHIGRYPVERLESRVVRYIAMRNAVIV